MFFSIPYFPDFENLESIKPENFLSKNRKNKDCNFTFSLKTKIRFLAVLLGEIYISYLCKTKKHNYD